MHNETNDTQSILQYKPFSVGALYIIMHYITLSGAAPYTY